jgi:hypothetical protein
METHFLLFFVISITPMWNHLWRWLGKQMVQEWHAYRWYLVSLYTKSERSKHILQVVNRFACWLCLLTLGPQGKIPMLPITTRKSNPWFSMLSNVEDNLITLPEERHTYNQSWILMSMSWDNGMNCMFLQVNCPIYKMSFLV